MCMHAYYDSGCLGNNVAENSFLISQSFWACISVCSDGIKEGNESCDSGIKIILSIFALVSLHIYLGMYCPEDGVLLGWLVCKSYTGVCA